MSVYKDVLNGKISSGEAANIIDDLSEKNSSLAQENAVLRQTTADLCGKCGWRTSFPLRTDGEFPDCVYCAAHDHESGRTKIAFPPRHVCSDALLLGVRAKVLSVIESMTANHYVLWMVRDAIEKINGPCWTIIYESLTIEKELLEETYALTFPAKAPAEPNKGGNGL